MSTKEDLDLSNSKFVEETHIDLMANVVDISDSDESDEEVDFSNIYSLREAYQEIVS